MRRKRLKKKKNALKKRLPTRHKRLKKKKNAPKKRPPMRRKRLKKTLSVPLTRQTVKKKRLNAPQSLPPSKPQKNYLKSARETAVRRRMQNRKESKANSRLLKQSKS